MVSFDVESLFINVPIEGAIEAARRRSGSDPSLAKRTTLAPAQIANLLGPLHMSPVDRASPVTEISPHSYFLCKNFDVFI